MKWIDSTCNKVGDIRLAVHGANLLSKKPTLPQLPKQNGDEESPEAEKQAPEGGVGLVADEESGRQSGRRDILFHSCRTEQSGSAVIGLDRGVSLVGTVARIGAAHVISTGVVYSTDGIPGKDLHNTWQHRKKNIVTSFSMAT